MSRQGLARYFLTLGTVGFGGPVALVARMERELVEERRWFTDAEFQDGVVLAQLAPGPLAAQVAMYLGWLRGGVRGATISALAFIAPSFLMVAILSALYVSAGGAAWLRAAFYGVGAVVVVMIARSALRLVRRSTAGDPALTVVATVNAVAVALTGREIIAILFLTGALPLAVSLARRRSGALASAFLPLFAAGAEPPPLAEILAFFAKSSLVVFGSGLAIIPFLRAEVVGARGWLTEPQFLDAIAVAMLTPGPVVITVAFIGWIAAGALGGIAAALGVFAPTWLMVIVVAPFFDRLRGLEWVRRLVAGITAAATGGLAGAVVVIGIGAISDLPTILLAALTLAVLVLRPRLPEPLLILAGAAAGLLLTLLVPTHA